VQQVFFHVAMNRERDTPGAKSTRRRACLQVLLVERTPNRSKLPATLAVAMPGIPWDNIGCISCALGGRSLEISDATDGSRGVAGGTCRGAQTW
jgi:hypothetical protein